MVHFVNFHFMCMGELKSAGQITRGLQTGLVFTGLARTEWANGDMDIHILVWVTVDEHSALLGVLSMKFRLVLLLNVFNTQ